MTRKNTFLRGSLGQVRQFGNDTMYGLDILHQCGKRVKTKSQKVLGLICTFLEFIGEKLVGFFLPPTILNRVNALLVSLTRLSSYRYIWKVFEAIVRVFLTLFGAMSSGIIVSKIKLVHLLVCTGNINLITFDRWVGVSGF